MRFSDNGVNILKRLEGCITVDGRHVIYNDKTGQPIISTNVLPYGATIGYGHLIKYGEDFANGITETDATELLRADIMVAERTVQKCITSELSQNQFDALVILAYNIGTKNFTNSTVVKYLNNPNYHSRIYQDLKSAWFAWDKSGGRQMFGLKKRRSVEWNLFNT